MLNICTDILTEVRKNNCSMVASLSHSRTNQRSPRQNLIGSISLLCALALLLGDSTRTSRTIVMNVKQCSDEAPLAICCCEYHCILGNNIFRNPLLHRWCHYRQRMYCNTGIYLTKPLDLQSGNQWDFMELCSMLLSVPLQFMELGTFPETSTSQ